MKKYYLFLSFALMLSTTAYSDSNQENCVNALDQAFRIHFSIIASSKDDEHPLSHNNIIDSFEGIKIGCNEQLYKMSIVTLGHLFFGNEIKNNNNRQKCISDIYVAYSIFAFNEERTAMLNNEEGVDIKKEAITKFEKSENCALQIKNKILEKIKGIES